MVVLGRTVSSVVTVRAVPSGPSTVIGTISSSNAQDAAAAARVCERVENSSRVMRSSFQEAPTSSAETPG
jgi:hypothetical protein